MDTSDIFEKMKNDTECDAVFESMNMYFAQMESAASLDMNSAKKNNNTVKHSNHNEIKILGVKVSKIRKKIQTKLQILGIILVFMILLILFIMTQIGDQKKLQKISPINDIIVQPFIVHKF
jgi:hypothetical protein